MTIKREKEVRLGSGVNYSGARGMKHFVDANGNHWLCDKNVDPALGLENQGCWNESHMAFNRND